MKTLYVGNYEQFRARNIVGVDFCTQNFWETDDDMQIKALEWANDDESNNIMFSNVRAVFKTLLDETTVNIIFVNMNGDDEDIRHTLAQQSGILNSYC